MEVTQTNPKSEFLKLYTEHIQNLSKIPITSALIKQLYPEQYQLLQELIKKLDEAMFNLNRNLFFETEEEIEKIILACYYDELNLIEHQKPKPLQSELKRACVKCEGNLWLILKPNLKASAIQCLSCGHIEFYIRGKQDER